MAKVKEDISRVRLELDGKQGINELGKLEMQAKDLQVNIKNLKEEQEKWTKESKKLEKLQSDYDRLVVRARKLKEEGKENTKVYENTQKRLTELQKTIQSAQAASQRLVDVNKKINEENRKLDRAKDTIKGIRGELGLNGLTMGQLLSRQRELNKEIMYGATFGTQKYKEMREELQRVNGAIERQRNDLKGSKGFWGELGKEIKAFGVLALGYLGADALFSQVQSLISGSAKLSDALSDVQKTTNLSDAELERLSQTLKDMNTRTARSELLGLAEIAGRLGIQGAKDIEGFVRAADKINVALGDSLGDPEKVMRELGKLTETFGVRQEFGIEQALLKVGSAINELGMASTANEGYLVEFTKRLGGVAPLANISIENVLGLGATLDSLGQTAEVSTTALSKLFIDMAKNAQQYARFAKMEVSDFVKLMNEDANEAFIRMLEGVKDNSTGITQLAATLGDLGQDGGRVVGVLGTLANNTERLREQQRIANQAFKEGTSVVNEFNLKNENFAANLEKIQKWMAGLFINGSVMKGLNSFVGLWARWIEIPISRKMEEERIELNKLYLQITSANTGTEQRIKLINQLKENYPGLLKNIDAEKVSNKQLAEAIRQTNEQLVNKIILQQQEEKIQAQAKKTADAMTEMIGSEGRLRQEMIRISEKYNLKILEGLTLEEQALNLFQRAQSFDKVREGRDGKLIGNTAKLNDLLTQYKFNLEAVNALTEKGNILTAEKEQLLKRLGISLEPDTGGSSSFNTDPENPDPTPPITPPSNEEINKILEQYQGLLNDLQRIREEYDNSLLDKDSQEIARIEERFQALRDKAGQYLESGVLDQQTYNDRINEINALQDLFVQQKIDEQNTAILTKRKELTRALELEQMDEFERSVEQTRQSFDARIAEMQKFGLDTVALEEIRNRTIEQMHIDHENKKLEKTREINRKRLMDEVQLKQGIIDITMEYSRIVGASIDLIGKKGGELTAFQKLLALVQIGIDTGAAIMKAELVALNAASAGGPAAPLIYKATKLSVIASILTAAGRAKALFSGSNVPQFNSSEGQQQVQPQRGRATAQPRNSFFFGGPTSGGLGFGDRYGEFAGWVHKREYVVPTIVTEDPWVANLLPAIESIRQDRIRGFASGGPTSSGRLSAPAPNMSTEKLEMLMQVMISKLDGMPKQVRAYLVYNDLEEMQEEMDKLRSRYTA